MYEIDDNNQHGSLAGGSLFGWLKSPACIALFLFMFGTMVLTGAGRQQIVGILLVVFFFFALVIRYRAIFPIPPEIKMYVVWVLWAGLTGMLVADDKTLLWYGGLRQILQVLVLVTAVYAIVRMHPERALKAMMFGVVIGGVLQGLVVRGALQTMGESLSGLEGETERVMGLTDNANTLGFLMIWALLAAITFWKQKQGKTRLIVIAGTVLLFPLLCYGIMASGSRKSLVAFTFVLAVWFWYAMAPRDRAKAVAWKTVVLAVMIALSGPVSVYVLNYTLAGKRMMERLSSGGTLMSSEQTRFDMHLEGLQMTLKNPVCGVGVNHFRVHSNTGTYSHSNYIEPLATTGIPGFILFQGIFFIPLFRAWRLTRIVDDPTRSYQLKVLVIVCATILLLGLGTPWYRSTTVMSFMAMVSGYTYSCLQQIRYQQWFNDDQARVPEDVLGSDSIQRADQ